MSQPVAVPATQATFGLPPVVPHLIAKLRNMDPAQLLALGLKAEVQS